MAQLADIATQQRYLETENESVNDPIIVTTTIEESEPIDVSGIVEENGNVLETFDNDHWGGGFNDDYDESEGELNIDGDQSTFFINHRMEPEARGRGKP